MAKHATSSQGTTSHHDRAKPITSSNARPGARFRDLPTDIWYRIASKLPPKEFARTGVLSTDWGRCTRSACPGLTFDIVAMCKCEKKDLLNRHVWQFVSEVNSVLQKHHGKVVETLQVRIIFVDSILARHIDTWVAFAAASRTKSLTLDLKPERFSEYKDLYEFPFQLLDQGSISRLQHMQLSFVFLNPPSWFKGFPNLRKLHLQTLHVSRKDLENMLSHCHTLEWLNIDRCNLDDALMVDTPLSHLLYLKVDCCKLTKIKFNAVNLAIFEYDGSFIPIDLAHSLKLKSANIEFDEDKVFPHMLASLLSGLPGLQNLTFHTGLAYLEKPWSWDNRLKFSNLRHLQLLMFICLEQVDKVLYSVSFLRATPFLEKLEVHFCGGSGLWSVQSGPSRKDIGHCKYNYLKDIWITGFKAARGQLEFLMLVVENAPALEVLLVEIGQYPPLPRLTGATGPRIEEAKEIATSCLTTVLQQNVRFDVKE
ncbi:unnamed protein product [Urochloa humidicola]